VNRLEAFNDGTIYKCWIDERTRTTQESLTKGQKFKEIKMNQQEGEENLDRENLSIIEEEHIGLTKVEERLNALN
jgi:hypothetical protein